MLRMFAECFSNAKSSQLFLNCMLKNCLHTACSIPMAAIKSGSIQYHVATQNSTTKTTCLSLPSKLLASSKQTTNSIRALVF